MAVATVGLGERPSSSRVDVTRRSRHRGLDSRLVVGAAAAVAGTRWWVSRERTVFHIWPDEPGQLAIARFMGAGGRWSMLDHSTRRPGYGTLISPITWFTQDPATTYQAALAVNAVLGGLACALACFVARRLTTMPDRWCVAAAISVSLAPAVLLTTAVVWAEALVQLAFLGFLLASLRFVDDPSTARGVVMIAAVATAFVAHSRLLPLAAIAGGLFIVIAVTQRNLVGRCVVLLGALGGALLAAARFSAYVVDRVWDDPLPTNTAGSVLRQLTPWRPVAASIAGQTWYQLTATVGLAGLGLISLVRALSRRSAPRARRDAAIVLASVGSLVVLSMVFIADRTRPDHLVYGRYNDAVMAPVVLVGIGTIVTASAARIVRDSAVTLGLIAASGIVLVWLAGDQVGGSGMVRVMVLGLVSYLGTATTIAVVPITLAAIVLVAGLAFVAAVTPRHLRPAVVAVALLAVAVVGVHRARPAIDRGINANSFVQASQPLRDGLLPEGALVRVRLTSPGATPGVSADTVRVRLAVYQNHLPSVSFALEDGGGRAADDPHSRYLIAAIGDDELAASGALLLWRDPAAPIGLWFEASAAQTAEVGVGGSERMMTS